jgi:hypothetical protein
MNYCHLAGLQQFWHRSEIPASRPDYSRVFRRLLSCLVSATTAIAGVKVNHIPVEDDTNNPARYYRVRVVTP